MCKIFTLIVWIVLYLGGWRENKRGREVGGRERQRLGESERVFSSLFLQMYLLGWWQFQHQSRERRPKRYGGLWHQSHSYHHLDSPDSDYPGMGNEELNNNILSHSHQKIPGSYSFSLSFSSLSLPPSFLSLSLSLPPLSLSLSLTSLSLSLVSTALAEVLLEALPA